MKKIILLSYIFISLISLAQKNYIVAGPMHGHTEMRTAQVWIQLSQKLPSLYLSYHKKDGTSNSSIISLDEQPQRSGTAETQILYGLYTIKFTLTALEPGLTYEYSIAFKDHGKENILATANVTTQSFWQWHTPAPDFSFLTGSCAYFNQLQYDRLSRPYGLDSTIFETMAKEKAAFMLWLGDNWYTRPADYFSAWGLNYRAARDRSQPVLQNFWKAMPQYAIWDDHDYGPNDADKSYVFKEESRKVFINYWCNPSYGINGQGTYTKITWNDVDIFMLDDRWFRSNDHFPDSANGLPNQNKKMFGDEQLEWLENALLSSNSNPHISFRIIATGSQVLNPLSPFDCFRHFPAEYNRLINFITENKINGVVFLTGDRHHSEIIKSERAGTYALYDITSSPLTSSVAKGRGAEINNPYRIGAEIDAQNFARISFSGKSKERKMTVEFIGLKGELLGSWSVTQEMLSTSNE